MQTPPPAGLRPIRRRPSKAVTGSGVDAVRFKGNRTNKNSQENGSANDADDDQQTINEQNDACDGYDPEPRCARPIARSADGAIT